MALAQLSTGFHSPRYPQANWTLLVLIPKWVCLCTFQDPVGPSNELSCEAGSFSCCCLNPPTCFHSEALRLYFSGLEPCVVLSVSLPSCSSWFICMRMLDHLLHQLLPGWVCQPLPCHESSPPDCLSPPLLLVWMNVSLTPWFSDFPTV